MRDEIKVQITDHDIYPLSDERKRKKMPTPLLPARSADRALGDDANERQPEEVPQLSCTIYIVSY